MSKSAVRLSVFLAIAALLAVALVYCTRPDPAVVIPDPYDVSPLQELHEKAKEGYFGGVQVPAQPEVAQPAIEPAKVTPPAVVKKPAKQPAKLSEAEQQAWVRGLLSAARARCLEIIVDKKIDYDVANHEINDFGDARQAPICQDVQVLIRLAQSGIEAGALARPPKR